jgi:hypothetical protein
MKSSKDQLYQSFISFINYAAAHLKEPGHTPEEEKTKKKITLSYTEPVSRLRSIITEKIETSAYFNDLVLSFSVALGREQEASSSNSVSWEEPNAVKNFLRRSRIYLNLYHGKSVDKDEYFQHLMTALTERNIRTISLKLIHVGFWEDVIDCGAFKIQRFSKEELDELFENELNHIFYPYAEVDTKKLSKYWLLSEEHFQEIQKGDISEIYKFIDEQEEGVYTHIPDRTTQLLTLFDWEGKHIVYSDDIKSDFMWERISIPASFWITNDIFGSPASAPILSRLSSWPVYDEYGIPVYDENGEEEEEPAFVIRLDEVDEKRFKEIQHSTQKFLQELDLKACNWEFIGRAMGYLAKAYFAEGLEQLLWHIIVLEALFGDKGEVMESIRNRACSILGKTEREKKSIRKRINELYTLRSDLVHGKEIAGKVYHGHLRQARQLARDSLIWFLTFLSGIKEELSKAEVSVNNYPHRSELLSILDLKKENLVRLGFVIEKLPRNFPNIETWGSSRE